MTLNFDINKIDKTLNDFHCATGVSISILDGNYFPLGTKKSKNSYCLLVQSTKKGSLGCVKSNRVLLEKCKEKKAPIINICHAGLAEMAIPIIQNDEIMGYVLLGHIRVMDEEFNANLLTELPLDINEARMLYGRLPRFSDDKIMATLSLAEIVLKHILFENYLHLKNDDTLSLIRKYVRDNAHKRLSVDDIWRGVHISRATLYNVLKKRYNCTASEYINIVKIDMAKKMLTETDDAVEAISDSLSFNSCSYFCKTFKNITGVSPLKYRQNESAYKSKINTED